jgi:hypothetical protein
MCFRKDAKNVRHVKTTAERLPANILARSLVKTAKNSIQLSVSLMTVLCQLFIDEFFRYSLNALASFMKLNFYPNRFKMVKLFLDCSAY